MDLASFAEVVSAIAVVIGLGFAVTELKRHRERKSRESTLALVQTFQTPEIAQALIAMVDLPEGLSKQELDDRLGSDTRLISLLMTTWESVGILLCRREIDIGMVEDFFGGPIVASSLKSTIATRPPGFSAAASFFA